MGNSDAFCGSHNMTPHLSAPKGEISVRTANVEDAAPLLALRLEALAMHPEAFAADVDKTAAEGEKEWVECINKYANTKSGAIMIARGRDELIGMSGIVRGHWPKTQHCGNLWGVYVKPDWRGYKIGEAIVTGCIEWAIQNNLTVVTLGVTNSNTAAIRCYTRCGFKAYGTAPKAIFYDGTYYDDLMMVKLI
jgi:RimJ/RimL family protein N-acetyltransferase